MGQQLFKVHLNIDDTTLVDSNTNLSTDDKDDISFFFPLTSSDSTELNNDQQNSNTQIEYVKNIQNFISTLTKPIQWEEFNTEIDRILMEIVVDKSTGSSYQKIVNEIKERLEYKQQLQTSLNEKLKYDNSVNLSIFAQSSLDTSSEQLSYFAIQSLISILLILIKSTQKNDPTVIQQILMLTSQLCEQLPMNCLSSTNSFLFKSLEPLTNYIHELSSTTDPILSKQATQILLNFAVAKGSFKDMLFLLNKLIFNTTDIYNLPGLFIQLNNGLTKTINECATDEIFSLDYLKSIGLYPDIQLKEFNGQFISSIILSHIDIQNQINSLSKKQIKLSSFSCEFHPNTFKYLFNIIQQLTTLSNSNNTTNHILNISLRLFTTHLQLLSDGNKSDLTTYINNDDLTQYFELLLKLNSKEASKALVYIINIQTSTFADKLSIIHKYILENKYPILITEFLIELNKNEILLNWIETLCNENMTLDILYSFIDLYFNIKDQEENKSQIHQIIFSFQEILITQLTDQTKDKFFAINITQLFTLITQYLTYIFKNYINQISTLNDLFIGLCLITKIYENFPWESIQSLFISILPLLTEYYLQNSNNEFICVLLGKMTQVLITGSAQDSLEIKHLNKLKLPIFTGGCVIDKTDPLLNSNLAIYTQFQIENDTHNDQEFLMSVYNNINEGAQLISKLKPFLKEKQRLLQKSIEEQAHDACYALFAVYLKHYRRINLAKSELSKTDQTKPHNQLLSIYEYANRIQTLFATIKGQGGDCNELHKQIKIKTLFLLTSVKESDLIPIIEEDLSSPTTINIRPKLQKQHSRWLKARDVLRLLRNSFQVCIRFKKLMLEKKEKFDYESLLNRTFENFIYGDFSKSTNENIQLEIDELNKSLQIQHQRALNRLITYRFSKTLIQNNLFIYLPYLKQNDLEWTYLNNIQASNNQLKEQISDNYYLIIKSILSSSFQSPLLIKNLFYLLNLFYELIDNYYLFHHELVERLFILFVSFVKNNISIDLKLIAFNWFRLFVLRLCENIQIENLRGSFKKRFQKQQNLVFNSLILNELKDLNQIKDTLPIDSEEQQKYSLKNLTFNWFIQAKEIKFSNKSQVELCINQYLILLFRCFYFYKQVLSICGNINYFQQLIHIYHQSQSNITRLLTIKLLRYLIPYIPDTADETTRNLIEKFLIEVLNSISDSTTAQEIKAELIFMYRTIMSIKSSWQIISTEFVFNSIKLNLNLNPIEMNKLLSSLFILGGYIEPYRLGSIVKKINDDSSLALIIDIDSNAYTVQYLQTNEIESVSIDTLQLEIDVSPPNLLSLPIPVDLILDILADFIQIDTLTNESLLLLQLKRYCVSIFYHILNEKKLVEIFMNKPYASIIAKLCVSNLLEKTHRQLSDLRVFNKQHLEQYCLSLDNCERLKQIIEIEKKDKSDTQHTTWDVDEINPDQLVIDALSASVLKYKGWKPYASNEELKVFSKGRIGSDEVSINSIPRNIFGPEIFQECGINHRIRGRIITGTNPTSYYYPTFTIDNLQLSEGKWYYCVRISDMDFTRIGWATNEYTPSSYNAIGDDKYSWAYSGYHGGMIREGGFYEQFGAIRWKAKDICGCGIEIDGKNTKIKYWLNGKLLGSGFTHDDLSVGPTATTKCNLLPNGPNTTYYPAVCISLSSTTETPIEFIFSPEDMQDCPLPNGYKPLLLPKPLHIENTIVDYPSNAYLIGNDPLDHFLTTQTESKTNLLRDFINEHHLETTFTHDDNHRLVISENSNGFLLPIDNDEISSLTISFDFEILSKDEKLDILLFTLDSTQITCKKPNEKARCVIIFLSKKREIKVYINNKCQTFPDAFHPETINKLNLYILPKIHAGIQNLAIWKYALSEEDIHRLFTYGLFYISANYQQLKEFQKQVKTISFSKNQQAFTNESLIPFNEPFTENIWKKKKKQIHENQPEYFKSHNDTDYSTIDLFGNKTYLVLDTSFKDWSEYTFILEISVPRWPITDERLSLITLNSICNISISHEGKLCLRVDETKTESDSTIILNEYFRLFVSVQGDSIQIYINNKLEIACKVIVDGLRIESNRIDLFKENDLPKNTTTEDTLRISFKSLTYLNQSITIDQFQSSTLILPPLSIYEPTLFAMGYKKSWIQSTIEQNKTIDILKIHRSLREQKQEFIKTDLENEQKGYVTILSRLNPSIDTEVLKKLINSSKFDTNEQIIDIAQRLFTHWIPFQSSLPLSDKTQVELNSDEKWFSQSVDGLGIYHNLTEWIQDKSSNTNDENNIYQLFTLNQPEQNQTTTKHITKSIQYSHQNISSETFVKSRIACEYGLTTIYARHTILNMIKASSYNQSNLFPLQNFGDYSFIVTLLKVLDSMKVDQEEKIDRIYLLINSILKEEIKQLTEHTVESAAPLFYHLQKDIIVQSIQILFKQNSDEEIIINEKQPNLNFILKILRLFVELIKDKSIDSLIPILFPPPLINLMFHLFLFIPIHQSKIIILHLFSILIQTNKNFKLNHQIQQFFFQLFIELTSNQKFRFALMDLVFVLLTKQIDENQREEFQSKFSEDIQNLFTTIDVIITWNDRTKHKSLPETFLLKSDEILGNDFILTEDEFQKSNQVFNVTADQELIKFMNNDQYIVNNLFTEFIKSLPIESEPNPTFYKNYLSLSNIPADSIQIRARFFYLLNKFIVKSLPLVDLNLPSGQNILTDQIQIIKYYLLSSTKYELLNESLEKTTTSDGDSWNAINFDTVKASTDNQKSENTMFYQAYQQLYPNAHKIFRRSDEQLWHAQYVGMHSSDAGGPYRDSITCMCSDICSTRLSLFILCPNGRTNSGLNRDCWIPNSFPPNKSIPNKFKKQYRFIGQLMGMAIRKKHYLNIKFPILVWKLLLKEQITMEDIENIDIQSFKIITEMEKNIEQIKSTDSQNDTDLLFSSIMSELRFDVVSSSGNTYELIPDGTNIPITAENFKYYCSCYRKYRLNEFNQQIDFIREGLYSVVPSYYLSLYTGKELEEAVCGKGEIDVELLKKSTSYGGEYNQNSPVIERFWTVLKDMFNEEQKKSFLIFVWGRSTLPTKTEDFRSNFIINPFDVYGGDVDKTLPRSHTCFFTIDLPAYSTAEIMCERLNYAISYCSSIDGDGMATDTPNEGGIIPDIDSDET